MIQGSMIILLYYDPVHFKAINLLLAKEKAFIVDLETFKSNFGMHSKTSLKS